VKLKDKEKDSLSFFILQRREKAKDTSAVFDVEP
jgi:hypothetical protein